MKKIMILAAAVAATVACTKSSIMYEDNDQQISLTPYSKMTTKTVAGTIDNATYPNKESFGVFAFYDKDVAPEGVWANHFTTKYIDGVEFTNADGTSTSANPYYWPKQGSLVFAGYSPFKAAAEGNANIPGGWDAANNGITFTAYTNPTYTAGQTNVQNDLMWFDTNANSAKANTPYPAVFKHALSQLVFNVIAANADAVNQLHIRKIEIVDVENKGSFASKGTSAPKWTVAAGTISTYTAFTDATTSGAVIATTPGTTYPTTGGILVMPQPQKAIKVYYTQSYDPTGSKVEYLELDFTSSPSGNWEIGKKYIYNITLGGPEQITINAKVEDKWGEGGNIDLGNN